MKRIRTNSVSTTRTSRSRQTSVQRSDATRSTQQPSTSQQTRRNVRIIAPADSERTESVADTTAEGLPDDGADGEVDHDADALNEVVMAVDIRGRNGTVGCAYYVARDETLHFMEDMQLGGVDVVDACAWLSLLS